MKNKYNVLAIRRELDNHIRNNAWNKFRSRLEDLKSKPELLQAVVLTNKSKLGNGGTLLHAIFKHKNDSVFNAAVFISNYVHQALYVQDSRFATPLHLAVANGQSTTLVEIFLGILKEAEKINSNELTLSTILMTTDKLGDTPLLTAAREDASHLIPSLLRFDENGYSTLVEHKRKKRVALWYCVSNESQCAYKSKQYFPPREVQIVLLSTFFALQRSWGQQVSQEDWHFLEQQLKGPPPTQQEDSQWTESYFQLILRALVACSHLLGKLSVKLMDLLMENDRCPPVSQAIDPDGKCLLHHVCLKDTRLLEDRTSANVTSSLLLELIKRHSDEYSSAIKLPNRVQNLPLHNAMASHNFDFSKDLMVAYPDALQHTNLEGELPIHILLKLASPFVDEMSTFTTTLSELRKACPITVAVRDGATRLYPFQLAACCGWGPYLRSGSKNGDDALPANSTTDEEFSTESDAHWVNMVYDLLLMAPQVILM